MKLVLDTNIILKALIENSLVRGILLSPNHTSSSCLSISSKRSETAKPRW